MRYDWAPWPPWAMGLRAILTTLENRYTIKLVFSEDFSSRQEGLKS